MGGEEEKQEGKRQGEMRRAGTWGVREMFSLFVTVELGAEKKKNIMGSYKKHRGRRRESRRREGDSAERRTAPGPPRGVPGSDWLQGVTRGTALGGPLCVRAWGTSARLRPGESGLGAVPDLSF